MTKVSIIIPCYNSASFIDRCLESAFEQTHPDLEIICVNDGSSDNTMAILSSWQEKHAELIVMDQVNKGATAARNAGTQKATGAYIQFLDSDDAIVPKKISHQLSLAETQGNADLVIGSYESFNEDSVRSESTPRLQDPQVDNVWIKLMRTDLGITSANLFRRDAVLEAGGWDEELRSSQEYDLMFRILQVRESYVYDMELLTKIYPQQEGSITSSNKRENWKRYIDLRLRIRSYVTEAGIKVDSQRMNQCLFDAIRQLYMYDSKYAVLLFKDKIPKGFRPTSSQVTSESYVKLFGIFGFKGAERIREMIQG